MKNFKAILHNRTFYGLLILTLAVTGVGGYVLLGNHGIDPIELTEASDPVSAPVEHLPAVSEETGTAPPSLPEATPEAPQTSVPDSQPVFIPDNTPVTVQAPAVVVPPLEGDIVTAFSMDRLMYSETLADWRTHDGVDIAAPQGTPVLAASAGTVVSVEHNPLMGTTVVLDHADGCRTIYANLQEDPAVKSGESVAAGQTIGAVGQTAAAETAQGAHLHFSVTRDGTPVDPIDYLH